MEEMVDSITGTLETLCTGRGQMEVPGAAEVGEVRIIPFYTQEAREEDLI